jgi:hypothetical protein
MTKLVLVIVQSLGECRGIFFAQEGDPVDLHLVLGKSIGTVVPINF